MIAGRADTHQGPDGFGGTGYGGGGGVLFQRIKGNSGNSEDVSGFKFLFQTGNDSNVILSTEDATPDADGYVRVSLDVYYV